MVVFNFLWATFVVSQPKSINKLAFFVGIYPKFVGFILSARQFTCCVSTQLSWLDVRCEVTNIITRWSSKAFAFQVSWPFAQEQADNDCGAIGEGPGRRHWEWSCADLLAPQKAGRVLPDQVRVGYSGCSVHLGLWARRHRPQHPGGWHASLWGKQGLNSDIPPTVVIRAFFLPSTGAKLVCRSGSLPSEGSCGFLNAPSNWGKRRLCDDRSQ